MSSNSSERFDLLDRIADEFAARWRKGEQPSVDEYVERYPDLGEDIRQLLPAMVEMEEVKEVRAEGEPPATPPLEQVGDYRLLREVGRGGMGVVYEAEQISLGRRVAVKVLPGQTGKRNAVQRFWREARSAAKLHHTNIVPVYEVGQDAGVCFYAMQFILGQPLDEIIDELKCLRAGRDIRKPISSNGIRLGHR
jgi:serine/threonine protein kinase